MSYNEKALELHKEKHGKLEVRSKVPIKTMDDLALAYTSGVAAVSQAIADDKEQARELTMKGNSVAVVSDGSAVLGLGNIGPEAALPVMEGKAVLFKEFADIDAYPIVLDTQDVEEIIATVKHIAPGFAGINLEDISAPRCFEIEARLQDIGIPVFHDDQHGTAVVVLAGLINATKVVGKPFHELKVVISGAGSAGVAIARLLGCMQKAERVCTSVNCITVCDSQGIISSKRENLSDIKREITKISCLQGETGTLADALQGADAFIGVSKPDIVTEDMVRSMAPDPIIFALANPVPEITPEKAKHAGAAVIASGRSDYPNQVNNAVSFPGIFRGVLDAHAPRVTNTMKLAAAEALAGVVTNPQAEAILPKVLDAGVVEAIADAVSDAHKASGAQ